MNYAVMAVVLLLLIVAGKLAYENSKLISKRNPAQPQSYSASMKYSVYPHPLSDIADTFNIVPLFRLSIAERVEGSLRDSSTGLTLTLCRVEAGKGEMVLADAQSWMLNSLQQFAQQSVLVTHEAFLDKAADPLEQEMLMKLESVISDGS
ncbi:hypothetical protein H1230_19790 [Paenibacillus sp. 19GGS1-52]|uniref:hypothetical protein n=1 Tax=Paenibacillus sp. 19GGS1-52 TaxID=2758563 RepID=UPI001EFC297A|nr:hypothetical protein [Paenibacillus sp. 19GGS1-52]ULO05332.1 hypothetical protein H1230_19790 [Paenibacillus sp. 19GGS1-52]